MMKRRWIAFLFVLLLLIPSAALAEETQPSSKTVYWEQMERPCSPM